jgi:hypothetical protein
MWHPASCIGHSYLKQGLQSKNVSVLSLHLHSHPSTLVVPVAVPLQHLAEYLECEHKQIGYIEQGGSLCQSMASPGISIFRLLTVNKLLTRLIT